MTNTRYFTLRMPEPMLADLQRLAAEQDRSVSWIIRHIIADHLEATR